MNETTTAELLRWAIPGVLALLVAAGLVVVTLRAGARRAANRRLAMVLAAEGLLVAFAGLADFEPIGFLWIAMLALAPILPWLYAGLLATLHTPLVAWLRGPRWLVLGAWPAALLVVGFTPNPLREVAALATILTLVLLSLFAIVVSLHARARAAKGSPARAKATAFAVAFITRDALLVALIAALATWSNAPGGEWLGATNLFAIVALVYMPLLAYGILRTQLFDIDLKIKRGARDALIGGALLGAFFLAEQAGQAFISERAGPFVGIAGACVLAVAFVPLKRLADRVMHRAMPRVTGTPEYVAARKLQVYRAAVEDALANGPVDDAARARLNSLATHLALHPRDMLRIEDEATLVARGPVAVEDAPIVPTEGEAS